MFENSSVYSKNVALEFYDFAVGGDSSWAHETFQHQNHELIRLSVF